MRRLIPRYQPVRDFAGRESVCRRSVRLPQKHTNTFHSNSAVTLQQQIASQLMPITLSHVPIHVSGKIYDEKLQIGKKKFNFITTLHQNRMLSSYMNNNRLLNAT